ncbi:MAG TPA: F0F1 ATP synthase subunit B [Candidatus Limnocylindria bacterium]|nr:F0F1 ATP synthase subunit B [Candidatus Limnocylindria bacterium]
MGAFFEAFQVDVWKLAFQIVNFLILLYLLNRFLFKPVLARLDERSSKISKGLEDAETAARDRELARAEREAAVSEARKEASNLIANANKIATDTRNEILAQAKADAEKVTARAREEITAEKDRAMSQLRAQVADLALDAAAKLVQTEMNTATHRRLVEEFLAQTPDGDGAKARR